MRKVQNGVEPFFFIKVKKSLPRWAWWFLFVVVQVEVQLDKRDHFDSIRRLGYTRSSTAPPIKFISLMLPGFLSHRNETHQTPNSRCLVPHGHACSVIKAILHGIPTYSLTQLHSLSSVLPNLLSLLQTCLLSSKSGSLFSKHFLIHLNKSIKRKSHL